MATKTLSVDEEAYERLRRARWKPDAMRCGTVLRRLEGLPLMDERILDDLDYAQNASRPPADKWTR